MNGRYNGVTMNISFTMPGAGKLAYLPQLSPEAKKRLKWFDYYHRCRNVSLTCRYFGISRKTFYYWQKRYNPRRLESLEEKSRRPKNTRNWDVSRSNLFLENPASHRKTQPILQSRKNRETKEKTKEKSV
ncbi:MAG: hypothetical protein COV00_00520 [Candidatus Tagabacteria bacterium CG10_big_fil_rev_8_21_14_0_10_40_13]|uniref:Insertion element IS150 protein InsJ-like helix-turn-helix domain-containing protein n=1 Tax=Candidatus Tagabacteria bacterium CG10_big_fil_rev_8_21_14_0_10_40_13 TaxID=1975022 RepID=A0A2M8L9M6_9BACT|nr:MAG: hypothetical protein COV00_00520 [Candidatus Tagabacteria bacterium CG10_big_fil_rev_8_21_14_0_10_40_13]